MSALSALLDGSAQIIAALKLSVLLVPYAERASLTQFLNHLNARLDSTAKLEAL